MITFGYAKAYQYSNDGTLMIKVRIPSVHGAYTKANTEVRRYTTM